MDKIHEGERWQIIT